MRRAARCGENLAAKNREKHGKREANAKIKSLFIIL